MKIKINYSNGNSINMDHVNDYVLENGTLYIERDWIYGGWLVISETAKLVESVEEV